jgi:hypothetical protein
MAGSNSETVIHLASPGDIRLNVNCGKNGECERSKTFVISAAVMCIASPVWRAMFSPSGRFMEAVQSAETKDVHFGEDDADALLLILRIAHLQFREIPEKIGFTELLNVAVICDKYDMAEIVQPWLSRWKDRLKYSATEKGYEGWLFISWTFGLPKIYEQVAQNLVLHLTMSNDGQGPCRGGRKLTRSMPPGAVGQ